MMYAILFLIEWIIAIVLISQGASETMAIYTMVGVGIFFILLLLGEIHKTIKEVLKKDLKTDIDNV